MFTVSSFEIKMFCNEEYKTRYKFGYAKGVNFVVDKQNTWEHVVYILHWTT